MKRVFALILTITLSLALFAGCSSKPATTPTATAPAATPTAAAAQSDWDYIKAKGEMVVGITLFAPMNYKDSSGKLVGFETEFAEAVCAELGVKAKFQEIQWKTKEIELSSKNIDCIWNGMTITDERKANMDISVPYMMNKQVFIVKSANAAKYADLKNLKGASVVAESESAGEEVVQKEAAFKEAKYTPVGSQSKVLLEVKSGTAEVGVIDYVMSIGSIGKGTDYEGLTVVPNTNFAEEQYGIAFRKNSPETTKKVNEAIQKLANNGTLAKIAEKYKLQEMILVKPKQ